MLSCEITFLCFVVLQEATCILWLCNDLRIAGLDYLIEVRVVIFIGPLIMMILLLLQIMVTLPVTGLGLIRPLIKLNLMALFVTKESECVILCLRM